MSSESPRRAPRSDAARNRHRILAAASELFADRGSSATLNDVARAAGVGVGTVYRNFADKDELLDALFESKLDTLLAIADDATLVSDAGDAFRSYLLGVMAARAVDRGLTAALMGSDRSERFGVELARRLAPVVEGLIARAEAAGELRAGMTPFDACVFAIMIGPVADGMRDLDPDAWRRYAQMLVDGTRGSAGESRPTPGSLSAREAVAAFKHLG